MPETVNLGGKPYPKSMVLGAVAVAASIAGYAWWTKGRNAGVETTTDYLVPEDTEPTGTLPFGGTQSGTFTQDSGGYRNEQEWFSAALDKLLLDYGVNDTPTAADALNRYLASQPLTATQVPMITFVINSIGPPPTGSRGIRKESPPGGSTSPPSSATPPGKVTSHRVSASRTEIRTNWGPPASGAAPTGYRVTVYQGVSSGRGVVRSAVWSKDVPSTTRDVRTGGVLSPNHPYDVGVAAKNAAGSGTESFRHITTRR